MPLKTSQSGFTLAEILVAISIIAVMAAISLPFYRSISMNLSLNSAARDLTSDLRQAQQLAVTEQINYILQLDQADNKYLIKNKQTDAVIKQKNIASPITILAISGLASSSAEFNATGASLSTGEIILTNPNLRQVIIEIKPSGYVKLSN